MGENSDFTVSFLCCPIVREVSAKCFLELASVHGRRLLRAVPRSLLTKNL